MRFAIIFLFLFCFSFADSFAQSAKSSFHPEGYGKLYNREHVYFVSVNTANSTEEFYKELNRRFGSPIIYGTIQFIKVIKNGGLKREW